MIVVFQASKQDLIILGQLEKATYCYRRVKVHLLSF